MATDLENKPSPSEELNPAQRLYEQEHNFSDIVSNYHKDADGSTEDTNIERAKKRLHTDAHGDEVATNYNADPDSNRKDIQKQEASPSSPITSPKETGGQTGRLRKIIGALSGGKGATGGIVGLILGGFGVTSILFSPGALLFAAIEKSLTNDGADFSRTNSVMFRAYNGGIFSGQCTGSKLKCKFYTMTKNQVSKYYHQGKMKVLGTVVDADGRPVGGGNREIHPNDIKDGQRVKLSSLIFRNGVQVSSYAAFEAEVKRNIDSRKWALNAIHNKAGSFFTSKFNSVLSKYGISKGRIARSDSKPPQTEEDKRRQVNSEKDKAVNKVNSGFSKALAKESIAISGATSACSLYNTMRIVVGAVKAKQVYDLVQFAFPFVQFASKIQDGSISDADFGELEKRASQLTWYQNEEYTKKLVQQNPDNATKIRAKKNLSATDSQGLRMAMYGDNTRLKDFTKDYTTAGISSIRSMDEFISNIQDASGGQQNIRTACITAQRAAVGASFAEMATCFIGGTVTLGIGTAVCAIAKTTASVAINFVQQELLEFAIEQLIKNLSSADIPSNLRGVDAGNALAAGMGLMLAKKSMGHGLKPAKSADEVLDFITATDDIYHQDYEEIARYEARNNPFDPYQKYSFAYNLGLALNPYITNDRSGLSALTNIAGIVSTALNPVANALYSQPSLMTHTKENLQHRLNVQNGKAVCPDSEKSREAGVVCDWSGRIVGITSKRVLQWSEQMARGDMTPLEETIDYMQQTGRFKNVGETGEFGSNKGVDGMGIKNQPYIDSQEGGTKDETCNKYNADIVSATFENAFGEGCKDSKKPSIRQDGTVIEGSQYSWYKKYCTEERELEIGSASEVVEAGTDKEQDWITGRQCARDSMMMDRFAFYFNMCEGIYAMANDATDCTNDNSSIQTVASVTPNTGDWVTPTSGPCLSPYGPRGNAHHAGIDISPPSGTPIVAPTSMKITSAGMNNGGYGYMVTGKATDGSEYSFRFAHMLTQPPVTVGQEVAKGAEIGKVGSTGDSTGPHLHFEIFPPGGNPATYTGAIDPVPVLSQKGVTLSCGS